MDSAADLPRFWNQYRLFPLPELVLFPHALLPLHIFEPRVSPDDRGRPR